MKKNLFNKKSLKVAITQAESSRDDEEYDSDVSEDGEGFLIPEDESKYEIRMRPEPTRSHQIKSLFFNTEKVGIQ